jgi:hypothetical protein
MIRARAYRVLLPRKKTRLDFVGPSRVPSWVQSRIRSWMSGSRIISDTGGGVRGGEAPPRTGTGDPTVARPPVARPYGGGAAFSRHRPASSHHRQNAPQGRFFFDADVARQKRDFHKEVFISIQF